MNPTHLRVSPKSMARLEFSWSERFLFVHSLWRRKPFLLVSLGVLAIAPDLFWPMAACTQREHLELASFDPQGGLAIRGRRGRAVGGTGGLSCDGLGALPGGEISEATTISNKGQIAGVSEVSGENFHAFYWDGGKMRDIGTLGGEISGRVRRQRFRSGRRFRPNDRQGMLRGFVWKDGKMRDLGHLGGGLTLASSINNRGGVVGLSITKDYLGTLSSGQDGKMRDIGSRKGSDFSSRRM